MMAYRLSVEIASSNCDAVTGSGDEAGRHEGVAGRKWKRELIVNAQLRCQLPDPLKRHA